MAVEYKMINVRFENMLPNWKKGGERQEEIGDGDVIIAERSLPVHTQELKIIS